MAVIVDPNLMKQWERKAREFTHYRVHSVKKTSPYTLPDADLYIFSYTQLFGWLEVFATGRFKYAAFDENTELRNGTEMASRGTQKVTGARVLCATWRAGGGRRLGPNATTHQHNG